MTVSGALTRALPPQAASNTPVPAPSLSQPVRARAVSRELTAVTLGTC